MSTSAERMRAWRAANPERARELGRSHDAKRRGKAHIPAVMTPPKPTPIFPFGRYTRSKVAKEATAAAQGTAKAQPPTLRIQRTPEERQRAIADLRARLVTRIKP
jgi:hypothetical protein